MKEQTKAQPTRRASKAVDRQPLRHMSRVFQVVADPILIEDLNGRIIEMNDEAVRVYGWTREELIGRPIKTLVPPERHDQADELLQRCKRVVEVRNVEGLRVTKDGHVHPVLITLTLLTDEQNQPAGIATLTKDITHQKATEAALREREERLRAIVNTAADAMITIDRRGIIEGVTPATEQMFGYTQDELVGQNVKILMPPPYCDEHDGYIARYLETGQARIIGIGREAVGRRKDGSTFPVDLAVSEVDHLDLFTGIIRDISDRREAVEALQREHEFTDSIIETAHAIILVMDTEGRIVRFNPFLEELSGYTLDEVRGKDWFETFLPSRDHIRIRELFQQAISGVSVKGNINRIVTKAGQERQIAWWAKTLRCSDGKIIGLLSVGQDITELKEAQDKLVRAERLSAIGETMTGLTHESRNALARSQANLRRLSRRLKDQPELLALIDAAIMAQEDLKQLFEDVRQYAAPIQLQRQPTDVGQLINETWEQLAPSREDRETHLQQACAGFSLECEIDRFHMSNAIRNILENALAACEDPVKIDVNYCEVQIKGRPFLRVAICNHGPGLEPEQADRVFDAFYTTKTRGTGLGLAIVKRAVEQHGGEVAIESDAGRGAEFTLTLPRRLE